MNPRSAQQLLGEVTRLRTEVRRPRAVIWFPLFLFGAVDAIGAPVVLIIGRDHLGSYFLPATVLAGVVCALYYRHSSLSLGVAIPPAVWLGVLLAATFTGALCSFYGRQWQSSLLNLAGPFVAMMSGYLVLWWWTRNRSLLAVVAVFSVAMVVILRLFRGDTAIALQLAVLALVMFVAGAVNFRQERGTSVAPNQSIE